MTVDIKLQVRFTAEEANLRNKLDLESLKEFCVNRLTVEGAMGKYEIEDMDGRSIFATSAYERYRV